MTQIEPNPLEEASPRPLLDPEARERPLVQTLSTLVRVPSVVGAEIPFMRALERELVMYGATVRAYEGILEARGSDPDSLIISTHVDRHGIVCTGPNEYQYAAFVAKSQGDLDGNSISEQMVSTIAERFIGETVESYDPWHGGYLGQGNVREARYCERQNNLVFELDGVSVLRPGTPLAYLRPLEVVDDMLSAQLDNVLTVALVVDMFRRGFRGTALFTAEEEAGRSWRYIINWFRRKDTTTDRLLVVDTSPYPDDASARAQDIVLRTKDAHAEFDAALVGELESRCKSLGIASAFKDKQIEGENEARIVRGEPTRSVGRTELGRVVAATDGAITGATLQLPTTGYHTANETVALSAIHAAIDFTDDLIAS